MPRLSRITTDLRAALLLGVSLAALAPLPANAQTASLTALGSLGGNDAGYESEINSNGVSNDGSVVVGDAVISGNVIDHAFRWTQAGGMADLGALGSDPANTDSGATAVSADGSVVVGSSSLDDTNNIYHAFRWTQAGGMADLGALGSDPANTDSGAIAVSADGSVVVGSSSLDDTNNINHAFRWTQAGGMADLGALGSDPANTDSGADAVSADGSVVVGSSSLDDTNNINHAFRWTQAGGMADLGALGSDPANTDSGADAVSADGSVVVGSSSLDDTNNIYHAFRWTQAGGMADLGALGSDPANTDSFAIAVSATGKIIVGSSFTDDTNSTQIAFRWTQATGMQNLNTLLANAGVNMSGIQLQYASGISQNGLYIAGYGFFSGIGEAYLVYYNDGTADGLVTASDVQASTESLSSDQRAALAESHATAGELLGMTRPVDTGNYTYAGTMVGSALGYAGGQWSGRGVTVLGGLAYGSEDYPNIQQGNAPTVAAAARYTFDDPFGDDGKTLHPYAELGGWVTPQASLTLRRSYYDGTGTVTGTGGTEATSWAEYGRGGLIWDVTASDRLTGYGELGQQYMSFGGYSETSTATNTFPATVGAGLLRMGVARIGGLWTHKLDDLFDPWGKVPVSVTLAGDVAQSFNVHSGLTVNVAGVGSGAASNGTDTWGEFGGRIEAQLTGNLALDLDLNGTTGGGVMGTALHGGAGLSYKF